MKQGVGVWRKRVPDGGGKIAESAAYHSERIHVETYPGECAPYRKFNAAGCNIGIQIFAGIMLNKRSQSLWSEYPYRKT
jgi:hypothetical protein